MCHEHGMLVVAVCYFYLAVWFKLKCQTHKRRSPVKNTKPIRKVTVIIANHKHDYNDESFCVSFHECCTNVTTMILDLTIMLPLYYILFFVFSFGFVFFFFFLSFFLSFFLFFFLSFFLSLFFLNFGLSIRFVVMCYNPFFSR